MTFTPVNRYGRALFPIRCPICGALVGAFYRDGLSLTAHASRCTDHCVRLWEFGRSKRLWRELPQAWRAPQLAAELLENAASKARLP